MFYRGLKMLEIKKCDRFGNEWIERTFEDEQEEYEWYESHCRVCAEPAPSLSEFFNDLYGETAFTCSKCGEKTIVS